MEQVLRILRGAASLQEVYDAYRQLFGVVATRREFRPDLLRVSQEEIEAVSILEDFLGLPHDADEVPDFDEVSARFGAGADESFTRRATVFADSLSTDASLAAKRTARESIISELLGELVFIPEEDRDFPAVNKSVELYLNNIMAESGYKSAAELRSHPNLTENVSQLGALVVAQNLAFLNFDDINLEELAEGSGLPVEDFITSLEIRQEQARAALPELIILSPKSVQTTFKQVQHQDWINENQNEDVDTTRTITDEQWGFVLQGLEVNPNGRLSITKLIDFVDNQRSKFEEQFAGRDNPEQSFFVWYPEVVQPEIDLFQLEHDFISLGTYNDPVLDSLLKDLVRQVPAQANMRGRLMDQFKLAIQGLIAGTEQSKIEGFNRLRNGEAGGISGVRDSFIAAELSGRGPDGQAFVEAARVAGISLLSLVDPGETNPIRWTDRIIANGVELGLPPVNSELPEHLNARQYARSLFAYSEDFRNAVPFLQDQIIDSIVTKMANLGLDPLSIENTLEYTSALTEVYGGTNNIAVEETRNAILTTLGLEDGSELLARLDRQVERGPFSGNILGAFNELGLSKDIHGVGTFTQALSSTVAELPPTALETLESAEIEAKLTGLRSDLIPSIRARIAAFLDTREGDREDLLQQEEVISRIDLIIDVALEEAFGADELTREVFRAFGGAQEFFRLNPQLVEATAETITEAIEAAPDSFFAQLGDDTDRAAVNEILQERQRAEEAEAMRQRAEGIAIEDERARLEFEESVEGQRLRELERQESRRQQAVAVFQPELERFVRGRIAGPQAGFVLQDIRPQLERRFVNQALRQSVAFEPGTEPPSPGEFLATLPDEFLTQQRREAQLRRTGIRPGVGVDVTRQATGPQFTTFRI